MPYYIYKCQDSHEVEKRQSISDKPLSECIICGKPCFRVIYAPMITYKGRGWSHKKYDPKVIEMEDTSQP